MTNRNKLNRIIGHFGAPMEFSAGPLTFWPTLEKQRTHKENTENPFIQTYHLLRDKIAKCIKYYFNPSRDNR